VLCVCVFVFVLGVDTNAHTGNHAFERDPSRRDHRQLDPFAIQVTPFASKWAVDGADQVLVKLEGRVRLASAWNVEADGVLVLC